MVLAGAIVFSEGLSGGWGGGIYLSPSLLMCELTHMGRLLHVPFHDSL
jgi:hypothetical protein